MILAKDADKFSKSCPLLRIALGGEVSGKGGGEERNSSTEPKRKTTLCEKGELSESKCIL